MPVTKRRDQRGVLTEALSLLGYAHFLFLCGRVPTAIVFRGFGELWRAHAEALTLKQDEVRRTGREVYATGQ